jgi:hypothetical protein
MKYLINFLAFFLLGCARISADAHEEHTHASVIKNGLAVSVVFDRQGRLWRAMVRDGRLTVDYSDDKGKSFGSQVSVNSKPEKVGADGELRPKIAVGRQGEIYVSWTQALDKPYSGNIKFSRSTDGGLSFSTPIVVNHNHDIITHRFDALSVTEDGTVYVAWIDKRDLESAKAEGRKYVGAAVYYAVSQNSGASFDIEHKVADSTCECCRIGLTAEPDNSVAAFWRHVYGSRTREHAVALLSLKGIIHEPVRASFDNWNIDACPHHGPAIARDGNRGWHLAWYDGGDQPGLSYATMNRTSWEVSSPIRFGNSDAQAAHPDLLSVGNQVYLVWRELSQADSSILLMKSGDGGLHWSKPAPLSSTESGSDNPFLVADENAVYLSWNTAHEGYRLIKIGNEHD